MSRTQGYAYFLCVFGLAAFGRRPLLFLLAGAAAGFICRAALDIPSARFQQIQPAVLEAAKTLKTQP